MEIAGILRRMGIDYREMANRAVVEPETMRKLAGGYQKASDSLMQSFRNIEAMHKLYSAPVRNTDKGNLLGDDKKPMLGQMAPVVSFTRAGAVGFDYHDIANQIDERVPTDCKDPNCFALRVEGDSMLPNFQPGDLIVVAPNSEPRNGNVVVARLRDEDSVLLKVYHQNGDVVRLTSYNQVYPEMELPKKKFRFIYPMYEMRRRR
jgi:SOS-response transcriptional repressor LexA